MPGSVSEDLDEEMECEGLLECFHGLKPLDREIFEVLIDAESALTVDDIAAAVDRERSTAYRALQRLVTAELARKDQVTYDGGGYCHVFRPTDPDRAADEMQRMLNDWYAEMGQLIGEFREKYGDRVETAPAAE